MSAKRYEFVLSDSNLDEGGRVRHAEAYLNLTAETAALFAVSREAMVLTTEGTVLIVRATGATAWANVKPGQAPTAKNLRSVPADALGKWLSRRGAVPGDRVYAYHLEDPTITTPSLWLFRHVTAAQAAPPAEAVDWDAVFGAVPERKPGPRDESAYYRGSGRKGAR